MKSSLRFLTSFVAGGILCLYAYPSAGQVGVSSSQQSAKTFASGRSTSRATDWINIPGPLRSFLRMAGISQKISPDDVLPLLARNVYVEGYELGKPTEFLLLLERYVEQARELQVLAGSSGVIHVTSCDDAGTLLQILGYWLQQGCSEKDVILATSNPDRAFLTIDSGFPLIALEEALQKRVPFDYPYHSTRVPVLLTQSEWLGLKSDRRRTSGDLVDVLLREPEISRLYWALARIDQDTVVSLQRSPGLPRLQPFAPVLDFYGSQIFIRSGHVVVPGGTAAESAWKDLVGADPGVPGEFVLHLVAKDNGWLASYFDVLSRVSPSQQQHLTESPRIKRVYEALRDSNEDATATTGVFRRAPALLVLFTRIHWEPSGDPLVPGDLEQWKEIISEKPTSKIVHNLGKRSRSWDHPDQLLEALAALSRQETDTGPLQCYLVLSEIDANRSPEKRLSPKTVRMLADKFSEYGEWYLVFSEFPQLSDESIANFMTVAGGINKIPNQVLLGNALGTFQANVGLWQILARQGEIPSTDIDTSWQNVVRPFAKISSSIQLFDAAHASLTALLLSTGKSKISQDELVDLLAGPPQGGADAQQIHQELAGRIHSVLDDQRLVSLGTLFALGDDLHAMAQGAPAGANTLAYANELREFELPRPIFTNSERISFAPRVYVSHHAELQIRTDLTKVIKGPGTHAQLEAARGQLAPFLRDTLVGLNYAYYEPPGAQVLHNNSLFVRAHDFSGITVVDSESHWQEPQLLGAGTPAGGGAYLMGSLADLPYALAMTEQDFIVPENVQALVWRELIPDLLVSATVPRWWNITPNELHAVTLYQRSGEEILTASIKNEQARGRVTAILSDRMSPQRLELLEKALSSQEDSVALLSQVMPADSFYLSSEYRKRFPEEAASFGASSQQLDDLCRTDPTDTNAPRLSKDFGVPHPVLARNYAPELLNVKPFPSFGGDSSRLFGESWESSNLYWARLADEKGYSAVFLNRLVPELTRRMATKIFATEREDWVSLQRAMQETGEEFRQGKIISQPITNTASSAGAGGAQ